MRRVVLHEALSDEDIAALLNAAFVPIKVDREERPDVDDVYMTSARASLSDKTGIRELEGGLG